MLKRVVPALKAETARVLSDKHSFTQVEIARELGITQAAVSKYLAGKYGAELRGAMETASVKSAAEVLAQGVVKRKPSLALNPVDPVCACCRELRGKGFSFGRVRAGGMRISQSCDLVAKGR